MNKDIPSSSCPLVVDLDGTLIRTDMLHESALKMFGDSPLAALCIPYWLCQGKSLLKQNLAKATSFDPALLPYNRDFLDWLEKEQASGRRVILCTASDASIAKSIGDYLGIFDDVIASDGTTNLAGPQKAHELVQRFGSRGFDYAGNAQADLPVWRCSRNAIIVNGTERLVRKVSQACEVIHEFPAGKLELKVILQVLRVHQWLKNLLL
jgi:phosphoserine phosphatase